MAYEPLHFVPMPCRRPCPPYTSLNRSNGENNMKRSMQKTALLCGAAMLAWPVLAADVTPDRLANPDKEPQNWLTNHRTYDGQRFSPLERINKTNVKGLKLAYAVPLGGGAGNEFTNATALAEDGF